MLPGRSRLLIVPYGRLHYLPFNLLYNGENYLIEQHEIVILPAAGLMTQQPPERPDGALAIGYSNNGLLPQTLEEAALVHQLFGGTCVVETQAQRTALDVAPRQILHIAAHGNHRIDQPDLSYVQLADGQLFTDDFLQEDLSYELVTLSGCNTGQTVVTPGEELIGLGRGVLSAGAGALLASLWRVEDQLTVQLMRQFYEALRAGSNKAQALRAAQLRLLHAQPELHPAFWGAFQLIGSPQPLSTTKTDNG